MWPLFFGSLIALMLMGIASFEMLVYILYAHHRSDWERAGEPIGLGQSGIRIGLYSWLFARHKLQKQLLFHIPSWVRNDGFAYVLLIIHKATVLLYVAGVAGFLILTLLLS